MRGFSRVRTAFGRRCSIVLVLTAVWTALIVKGTGGAEVSRALSNFGLTFSAMGAAAACAYTARNGERHRRMWGFLAGACLSWGLGQAVWTAYESIPPHREVPFPSFADVGYLGLVPLAAAALISLPTVPQSLPGRIRTLLDGMMIAGSLLLTSWVFVLKHVFEAGGDGLLAQVISLSYPAGDVVIATIVVYVILRHRQTRAAAVVPIGLIAAGLAAFSISDSGFAYLTATGGYSSGSLIDIGWFMGFVALALAGLKGSAPEVEEEAQPVEGEPIPVILPYAAVLIALVASTVEVVRAGAADLVVTWLRSGIMLALVARQIVTLLENLSLTRRLHGRLEQLGTSQQRFEALVQHSSDVVTLVDVNGRVIYQSESIARLFGWDADSMSDYPVEGLLEGTSAERFRSALAELASEPYATRVLEVMFRHASGRVCHAEMTITNLLENGSVGAFVLNTRDISERKMLQDQLVHEASHDALTDLANRALFTDRVEDVLRRGSRNGHFAAVLYMDLDGFKSVNDSLGHPTGDLLLGQFAKRLANCVRPGDVVARLGGDEFAILIDDQTDYQPTIAISKRVTAALQQAFVIDGHEIGVSASIGIAAADGDITMADQLLRNADLAMYRAKSAGHGGYAIYDPKMHARLVERLQLEADLRRALDNGEELLLHYQPIIDVATGQITGFEALVRWQHPTRGFLGPDRFIPIAEETGLIRPLGRWVLDEACAQLAEWRTSHNLPGLTVSVNVSGHQLRARTVVDDVSAALSLSGLPPQSLILEITESVLMDHSEENLDLLRELKDMGLRLAMDDFGTGYSSLSYLHRFPIDILKIDRSFVERLSESAEEDSNLVATIVRLSQSLRMATVAEGVEEVGQLRLLQRFSCERAQGYLFSRPVVATAAEELLTTPVVGFASALKPAEEAA